MGKSGRGGSLSRLGFAAFLLSAARCLLCAEGSAPTDCANVHRRAGQWRCMVTDSSHQAAGKKGAFPCSGDVFLPPCRVSDCRFHQMFIREGCGQRENSSQNHLFCVFVGCWAQRQWGGVEVTAGLWGRVALVCFSFRGTGRVLASRSGTAYGPVSSWPSPNEPHFPLP